MWTIYLRGTLVGWQYATFAEALASARQITDGRGVTFRKVSA